jgi:hypothetical protein
MSDMLALLRDRKRAQRGSVLSGVLIITAFLAIITGALMTELSTNFILARDLVNRNTNEATVSSAMELALNQLQQPPVSSGCPNLQPASLNGQSASVSYLNCAPIASRSPQLIASSGGPFTIDGTHALGSGEYVVADSGGTVFGFPFEPSTAQSPGWSVPLNGSVTGSPMATLDGSNVPVDVVPAANASALPATGAGCGEFCVALIVEGAASSNPTLQCYLPTMDQVTASPAEGLANPQLAFFGDHSSRLYAFVATGASQCARQTFVDTGYGPVVAGPVVFQNGSRDELFVVVDGNPARLLHYTFRSGSFGRLADNIPLPATGPVGMATQGTKLAVAFGSGTVAVVKIDSGFDPTVLATRSVGSGIADSPYWAPGGQIGVGGTNGTLYVLDPNLSVMTSYAGVSPIHTTPAVDAIGDWLFGADDGNLYEVPAGQTNVLPITRFGAVGGSVGSGVQVGNCSQAICVYFGALNNAAYLVTLDARQAVLTSCITGQQPCLWARVQVDTARTPQTVHVQGWSYYSP